MRDKVQKALDSIRPALQADGGDIELVSVDGNVVRVRLKGACGSCPMAVVTLRQGVEMRLKQMVPEVSRVEAV